VSESFLGASYETGRGHDPDGEQAIYGDAVIPKYGFQALVFQRGAWFEATDFTVYRRRQGERGPRELPVFCSARS